MTPAFRFEKLAKDFPMPWQITCQYVAGVYCPVAILDADGNKVMECDWASCTPEGQHMYAAIVEATQDRVKYGNPWSKEGGTING